jgi:toxin ParE1/3/4
MRLSVASYETIAAFIQRDSLWYAQIVTSKIVSAAETIVENPEMGSVVPEFGSADVRERFVHSNRVIYHVEPSRVLVAAVIHGSRLLQPFVQRIEDA